MNLHRIDRISEPGQRFMCPVLRLAVSARECSGRQCDARTTERGAVAFSKCVECRLGPDVAARAKLTVPPVPGVPPDAVDDLRALLDAVERVGGVRRAIELLGECEASDAAE